ncbi:hypothetical protein [Roseateles asaccharophilus]|uniref:Uncharacterized protein n=1 Tax=Roseateles asaccharophilus TaxID=582607 RepID=A0ABU2A798_9BURK|nr:hypothetical protein [Roseateles asaccharophilus]MDR7333075.1 hypothetical protein [Roseateles asaccharophilus]
MNVLPTPRRLLNALMPQPGNPASAGHGIEPMLVLDALPPLAPEPDAPLRRRAIEQALEEGSRRVYEPMQEAEVIERRG